jgi:GNAT superfamily N-acetyltransferase
VLRLATDEEKRARDRLAYDAWGTGLSVDQFVERERRLRAHGWAAANLETWLLIDGELALSSCESFCMPSWRRAGDGRQAGVTFGIASVFTERALRRRGYAQQLVAQVVEALRARRPQASILFSDVGDYYTRVGYRRLPALDRVFPAEAGAPERSVDRLLTAEELDAQHAAAPPPDGELVVWPSAEQLDWHRERARVYGELLGRPSLAHAGARAGRGTIAWAADFPHGKLAVLYLRAERLAEAQALMEAARRQAAEVGLAEVVCWESPLPFGWPDGVVQERDHSVPMIYPFERLASDEIVVPRGVWV